MHENEFKTLERYLLQLKDEKADTKFHSNYKTKDFYALMPIFLRKHSTIMVRDYLDTDGTFAIVIPADQKFSLLEALNLYLDISQVLADTTYANVRNTGFIELEGEDTSYQGFWILLA